MATRADGAGGPTRRPGADERRLQGFNGEREFNGPQHRPVIARSLPTSA